MKYKTRRNILRVITTLSFIAGFILALGTAGDSDLMEIYGVGYISDFDFYSRMFISITLLLISTFGKWILCHKISKY